MTEANAPAAPTSALKSDRRLGQYFANEDERRAVTRAMFDQAATGYDSTESLTALGSGSRYRREVLRHNGLAAGMSVLDVAAGTGLVTAAALELVGPHGKVWALDPSPGMLAELRKKMDVETIEAYAESIPLSDGLVDFVSMGYALRHVGDLDQAFAEYYRVLKPHGRVCLMEISRPRNIVLRGLLRFHIAVLVPTLARLSRRHEHVRRLWAYYGDTIEAALEPELILDALRRAGFSDVQCDVSMGVFREYIGRKI